MQRNMINVDEVAETVNGGLEMGDPVPRFDTPDGTLILGKMDANTRSGSKIQAPHGQLKFPKKTLAADQDGCSSQNVRYHFEGLFFQGS
jgi:hypothetical protein